MTGSQKTQKLTKIQNECQFTAINNKLDYLGHKLIITTTLIMIINSININIKA